jgi:hypothetical protein
MTLRSDGGDILQVTDAPLGAGGWKVPETVTAAGGTLLWESGASTDAETPSDLLDRFANLAGADDASVVAFAARWGPLFYMPDNRGHGGCRACQLAAGLWPLGEYEYPPHGAEPIDAWRRLVGDVVGVLRVAAAYHRDEYVTDATWASFRNIRVERLSDLGGEYVATSLPSRPGQLIQPPPPRWDGAGFLGPPAQLVGAFTNLLLERVRLRAYMAPDGRPTARIEPAGLVGALGLQLMQKISKTAALALCAGCARSFTPKRKPSTGRKAWCDACRVAKIPERQASRDYRARVTHPPGNANVRPSEAASSRSRCSKTCE